MAVVPTKREARSRRRGGGAALGLALKLSGTLNKPLQRRRGNRPQRPRCLSLCTHHGGRGGCCLRSGGLVDLVLGGFDLGLQVCRWVEVFALFPGAPALDVIHAHGHRVIIGVDHGAVRRVREATVALPTVTVASLVFPAHLWDGTQQ